MVMDLLGIVDFTNHRAKNLISYDHIHNTYAGGGRCWITERSQPKMVTWIPAVTASGETASFIIVPVNPP
jgi:hypothetical protein